MRYAQSIAMYIQKIMWMDHWSRYYWVIAASAPNRFSCPNGFRPYVIRRYYFTIVIFWSPIILHCPSITDVNKDWSVSASLSQTNAPSLISGESIALPLFAKLNSNALLQHTPSNSQWPWTARSNVQSRSSGQVHQSSRLRVICSRWSLIFSFFFFFSSIA